MLPSIIFATNNAHKVEEVRAVLGGKFQVLPLKEAGIFQDIPEPHDTLEDNALEKANTIFKLTGQSCFSEDTGLEIEALQGRPGVRSARYAGDQANAAENTKLVLSQMEQLPNRKARFRTVIALILEGKTHLFEGICPGQITTAETGEKGFGYDPIFIPEGASQSFAQMTMDEKNMYSHRRKAMDKLISFLDNHYAQD